MTDEPKIEAWRITPDYPLSDETTATISGTEQERRAALRDAAVEAAVGLTQRGYEDPVEVRTVEISAWDGSGWPRAFMVTIRCRIFAGTPREVAFDRRTEVWVRRYEGTP